MNSWARNVCLPVSGVVIALSARGGISKGAGFGGGVLSGLVTPCSLSGSTTTSSAAGYGSKQATDNIHTIPLVSHCVCKYKRQICGSRCAHKDIKTACEWLHTNCCCLVFICSLLFPQRRLDLSGLLVDPLELPRHLFFLLHRLFSPLTPLQLSLQEPWTINIILSRILNSNL